MEKYPENTEIAFEGALRVGSHGLETGMPYLSYEPDDRRPYVVGWCRCHLP